MLELLLQGVRYSLQSIQFPSLYWRTHRGSESTNTIHSPSPIHVDYTHTCTHFLPSSSCLSKSTFPASLAVLFHLLNICCLLPSGYQDMEKTGSLSARMKGGGGIGITGEGRGEGESHSAPSRPYPPGIHPGGKTLKQVSVYHVMLRTVVFLQICIFVVYFCAFHASHVFGHFEMFLSFFCPATQASPSLFSCHHWHQ